MALDFGSGQTYRYKNTSPGASLITQDKYSVWAWVYPTTVTSSHSILRQTVAASWGAWMLFRIYSSNLSVDAWTDGNQVTAGGTSAIQTNVWQFVAATYDIGTSVNLYLGDLDTVVADDTAGGADAGTGTPTTCFEVGINHNDAGQTWDGTMAIIGVTNTVLTLADLRALQFNPFARPMQFLGFLGFHGVSTIVDMSGNGNAFSAESAAAIGDHVPLPPPFGFDQIGAGHLQSKLIEDVQIQDEARSIIYGHDTAVAEDTIRDFADGTLNVGATILGSGDSERISINVGDSWESLVEYVGAKYIFIEGDQYGSLGSGSEIVRYRTGASKQACEAAGWTLYTGAFLSSGWVQVKVER